MARRPQELRLDVDADLQRLDADTALPTLRSALKQARSRILARATACTEPLAAEAVLRTKVLEKHIASRDERALLHAFATH